MNSIIFSMGQGQGGRTSLRICFFLFYFFILDFVVVSTLTSTWSAARTGQKVCQQPALEDDPIQMQDLFLINKLYIISHSTNKYSTQLPSVQMWCEELSSKNTLSTWKRNTWRRWNYSSDRAPLQKSSADTATASLIKLQGSWQVFNKR